MKKQTKHAKTIGFLIKLAIALAVIGGIVVGGYFVIDKAVIPSYFGKYGINDLGDLVQMVKVMHNAPDEKTFVTHAYTKSHELAVITKLEQAGVPVESGKINFKKIVNGDFSITPEAKQGIYVSDYEMGAVLGQMLESGHLVAYLSDLAYFDTMSFTAKEVVITPSVGTHVGENGESLSTEAHISLIVKIDTTNAQKHMAKEMDVPLFLLNLIMPKSLYVTCTYDVSIDSDGNYSVTHSTLGINGRSPKQSEILINILISFIFPAKDEMTPEKLSDTFGNIVNSGLRALGDVEFYTKNTPLGIENGIFVKINPLVQSPETPEETE